MKMTLLAFTALLSLSAFAQVRPGTGPNNTAKSFPELESDLTQTLTQNSQLCGSKKFVQYSNLMDVYFKFGVVEQLSKLKSPPKVVECEQEKVMDENMRCLFSSGPAQDQLEEVLKDKWSFTRYYNNEHSLSEKESDSLYNFFVKVQKESDESAKKGK